MTGTSTQCWAPLKLIKLYNGDQMCLSVHVDPNVDSTYVTPYSVIMEKCNGSNIQKWRYTSDGTIRNKELQKCLEDVANNGLVDCDEGWDAYDANKYNFIPRKNNKMLLYNWDVEECVNFYDAYLVSDRVLSGEKILYAESRPCENKDEYWFKVPQYCFFEVL